MHTLRGLFCGILAVFIGVAFLGRDAFAVELQAGDIVVATQTSGKIYQVNPVSGLVTAIASGGQLNNPFHLIIDPLGRILTSERTSNGDGPAVLRIDPATGAQQRVAYGPLLSFPTALAMEQNGKLLVGEYNTKRVIRADLLSNSQSIVTSSVTAQDLEVDSNGQIIMLDSGFFNSGGGKIFSVNPITGAQATIAQNGFLFNPSDLLISPDGSFLVANRLANSTTEILRIDPINGNQQLLKTLNGEGFIALKDSQTLLFGHGRSIDTVNLINGATLPLATLPAGIDDIVGIAVVPEPSSLAAIGTLGVLAIGRRRQCIIF